MSITTSPNTPSELRCSKCCTTKPIEDFGRDRNRHTGRTIYCRDCTRAIQKEIRKRNNAQRTEYNRQYRTANRQQYRDWERENYTKRKEIRLKQAKNWRETLSGSARMLCLAAQHRSQRKSLSFEIDANVIETLIKCQGERCALTGISFNYASDGVHRYRPFAPSIDRKDNSCGYTYDNIRIVCCIVNKARNEYPIELFDLMCRARVEQLNRAA